MSRKTKTYIHPKAIVDSKRIGSGTRVWAFAHILKGAVIGKNCNICDHCFIENDVKLGDNATVKSGVFIWDGVRIEDDVFIGPNVSFTNDTYPRSKKYPKEFEPIVIKKGASVGAGSVLLPGITIGKYAMVGAGSVVTKNVKDYELVYGNPASHRGFMSKGKKKIKI